MNKKTQEKRRAYLLEKAIDRILSEGNIDVKDYLSYAEGTEFMRLEFILGYSDCNPRGE